MACPSDNGAFQEGGGCFVKGGEMSSRGSDLSWRVSRALQELLVLWAAARGQDRTSPNPAGRWWGWGPGLIPSPSRGLAGVALAAEQR